MMLKRKCANCGKDAVKEFLPFCSKRCADVDLARWFRGDYSVPVVESDDLPDDFDDDAENHTQH